MSHEAQEADANLAEIARLETDRAAAVQARDQALAAARAEMAARVRLESQLSQAHEEIARLEEVLRQARRKVSIRGARKVIDAAIGKESR